MIHTVWVMHSMNTCWMCIWHMFDRLMLTNVHWLVLHDWIKPAGWKQPDSKFIYKGRRALTQQKINKVRLHQYHIMYNRSFSNNLNFFPLEKFDNVQAKFGCVFIQHVEKPVPRFDEECHWQALSSRVISKSQLDLKWPQKMTYR